ncbi:MAG: sodium:proton antiporter [Streptomyces sp.]|uniref:DUF6328 family protein n=1 Tax=Streptomyces sp. TaxID=1931 RepID=UPI0025DABC32|nr:DUF6328 family protein [Streptomyces sp.]MBW8801469.1 sodium:proton antiporter [Streptomyces sp.]
MQAARPDETPDQTLDRNWSELLQELRVVQTGVQLLTGFLLTLPFQQRFTTLDTTDRRIYLATVASSSLATLLLVTPVPLHRVLFRQHERATMVATAHWCALLGSMLLGLSLIGVNTLVFDVVVGRSVATGVAAVVAGLVLALWLTMPLVIRFVVRSRSV